MLQSELFKYLPEGAQEEFISQSKTVLQDKERRMDIIKIIKFCYDVSYKTKAMGLLTIEEFQDEEWDLPESKSIKTFLVMCSHGMCFCDQYAFVARCYAGCPSQFGRFCLVLYGLAFIDNIFPTKESSELLDFMFSLFPNADEEFISYKEKILLRQKIAGITPLAKLGSIKTSRVTIPTEITEESYSDEFFHFCDNTLYIPKTIKEIDTRVFNKNGRDFFKVESVYVDPQNRYFKDIDGNLYEKNVIYPKSKILLYWFGDEPVIKIPEGVIKIEEYAICNKKNLEKIIFPFTLTDYNEGMYFCDCPKLTTLCFKSKVIDFKFASSKIETLVFLSEEPPILQSEIFHYDGAVDIVVPQKSVEAYKRAPVWRRYRDYICGDQDIERVKKEREEKQRLKELELQKNPKPENVEAREPVEETMAENKAFFDMCASFSSEQKERVAKNSRLIIKAIESFDDNLFSPSIEFRLKEFIQRAIEKNIPCVDFLQENFDVMAYSMYGRDVYYAFEKSFEKETDPEKRYYKFLWKRGLYLNFYHLLDQNEKNFLLSYIPE